MAAVPLTAISCFVLRCVVKGLLLSLNLFFSRCNLWEAKRSNFDLYVRVLCCVNCVYSTDSDCTFRADLIKKVPFFEFKLPSDLLVDQAPRSCQDG